MINITLPSSDEKSIKKIDSLLENIDKTVDDIKNRIDVDLNRLNGASETDAKESLVVEILLPDKYWDYNKQSFIVNKSRCGSSLFINTELEIREELDPIIIAWISGVPRSHIIDGKYEGHILISDVIKPTAKQAITSLKSAGIKKTVMLTGDMKRVADS